MDKDDPPLVKGGQGRSGESLAQTAMYLWWLAAGVLACTIIYMLYLVVCMYIGV